jgi:hypothetical protein
LIATTQKKKSTSEKTAVKKKVSTHLRPMACAVASVALAPPPPADTTWSPVECDQEVRFNVIRMQTLPRRPWAEKNKFRPPKNSEGRVCRHFQKNRRPCLPSFFFFIAVFLEVIFFVLGCP